ncbi:thiamine diphosphate-binding protein [Macrolepiota fuliginosa MF-IS2]|uniref:Thiamine diphosphate-binding protein n=1 Tax=Macrolepiota fuliginosa MF-IS2 TaxID=1400762 RepID=A0A9P5XEP6_9AGAR|nr:thiamine diphosphate-binding protein [Macrolepiota fuliginosa MF-IS2]
MYTASSIFLKALADAGITHAFVNWGSDHPGLLEDLERQRIENGDTALKIVTCPNEMVALSAAQGYGQIVGKPAAVIVHVDVGTQALAGAVHNTDRSRTPILIYAGASPFSYGNEHKGSRNEWIMWLQDIPDQSAIVRQYMRHTAQLNSATTIPFTVSRGLQFATSEPKGPVYMWARREVMEEEVNEAVFEKLEMGLTKSPSIEASALSPDAARRIASALLTAQHPLIITSRLGRNPHAIPPLLTLSTLLAIPVISTVPQTFNCPFSHPYNLGVTYLYANTHTRHLASADVILVIDTDLPWVPGNQAPPSTARVFIVDGGDPLQLGVGYSHFPAELICRADAELALTQLVESVRETDDQAAAVGEGVIGGKVIQERGRQLSEEHQKQTELWDVQEALYPEVPADATLTVPNLLGALRKGIQTATPSKGNKTLILNESVTNYHLVWGHLRLDMPGSLFASGGSSLGWGLGAAVGAYLGAEVGKKAYDLIVLIVGDGSFMFGIPSTAFWMARKYQTPFLTIILNNGGWKAPKASMMGVHPTGHGSKAPIERLTTGFGPDCPDYSQIAVAASSGWAWGQKIGVGEYTRKETIERSITEAIKVVLEQKRCAVLDCVLEPA